MKLKDLCHELRKDVFGDCINDKFDKDDYRVLRFGYIKENFAKSKNRLLYDDDRRQISFKANKIYSNDSNI